MSRRQRRFRYGHNTAEIKQLLRNRDRANAIQAAHDAVPTIDSKTIAAQRLPVLSQQEPRR